MNRFIILYCGVRAHGLAREIVEFIKVSGRFLFTNVGVLRLVDFI